MREMIYTDGWGFNPIPNKTDIAMYRAHTDREVLIRQLVLKFGWVSTQAVGCEMLHLLCPRTLVQFQCSCAYYLFICSTLLLNSE